MLLRAIAIVVSVLLHAWTGNAMWSLLEKDELQVFHSGKGLDVVLEPPALVASEITSTGDNVASIHSLDAVAAIAAPPPPLPSAAEPAAHEAPAGQPPEVNPVVPAGAAPPIAAAAAAPEQLPEVIDSAESKTAAYVDVVAERTPPPRASSPTGELSDVITSHHGPVADEALSEASEIWPGELPPQPGINPEQPVPPLDTVAPETETASVPAPTPETLTERRVALAAEPARPQEIAEPAPAVSTVKRDAEQLAERRPDAIARPAAPDAARETRPTQTLPLQPPPAMLNEPRMTTAEKPRTPDILPEQAPETIEVISQPQQIVIVTELSSGEEKSGGDATAAGLYLGRVSEQVQRAKVNPRSRMTGTAVLKFTVGIDGRLLSKEVAQSSGHPVLDDAAITTLDRAAPFPPIPPEVSKTPMTFQQPFRFVVR